ncbi:MAG: putative ligase-like protein [Acidimicrobiaceae bacterium]|nr:putative ligase-like protein [Acidimicrobiaceae bacterium]
MRLPVMPPVAPMLASPVHDLPLGEGLLYEPKWDGFRTIVFRDGDEVVLTSRNERPLTRYFPELIEPLRSTLPDRVVLDGEIVIVGPQGLEFEALLERIHPAASRVEQLSRSHPASLVAFDLLALDEDDVMSEPFSARRARLEKVLEHTSGAIRLTPATEDPELAREWFTRFEGGGLDGVLAKRPELPYRPGERVMAKLKHERTADCVVGGLRRQGDGPAVASLLLGLYDDAGTLHHVGVAASFTRARRLELADELEGLVVGPGEEHPWIGPAGSAEGRRPGGQTRWNAGRDLSFVPLRPEKVCEVAYDHLQGDRFRHATTFRRFRDDRDPPSCTYAQLEEVRPAELDLLFNPPPSS